MSLRPHVASFATLLVASALAAGALLALGSPAWAASPDGESDADAGPDGALDGAPDGDADPPSPPKVGEGDGGGDGGGGGDEGAGQPEDEKARRQREREERRAKREAEQRKLAPDSPQAEALRELLATQANYAEDGTVELRYTFTEPEHATDWDQQGFDRAEGAKNQRGRNARRNPGRGKTRLLLLSAGSQSPGLLLHKLHLRGTFEVELELQVSRMTNRSDLVLVVGKGGVRFGDQPVKASGSSFRPVGPAGPSREAIAAGRRVKLRVECGSGKLTAWVDGAKVLETDDLEGKLAGRIGLYAKDATFVVHQLTIKGEIDPRKL